MGSEANRKKPFGNAENQSSLTQHWIKLRRHRIQIGFKNSVSSNVYYQLQREQTGTRACVRAGAAAIHSAFASTLPSRSEQDTVLYDPTAVTGEGVPSIFVHRYANTRSKTNHSSRGLQFQRYCLLKDKCLPGDVWFPTDLFISSTSAWQMNVLQKWMVVVTSQ